MNRLVLALALLCFSYSQCDEGEVEIWESCYSILETTQIHNSDATGGQIPDDICLLENLEVLD